MPLGWRLFIWILPKLTANNITALRFSNNFLETKLCAQLNLARVKSGCRRSEIRHRCRAASKRISRHGKIGVIEKIKTFRQNFQAEAFAKFEPTA